MSDIARLDIETATWCYWNAARKLRGKPAVGPTSADNAASFLGLCARFGPGDRLRRACASALVSTTGSAPVDTAAP